MQAMNNLFYSAFALFVLLGVALAGSVSQPLVRPMAMITQHTLSNRFATTTDNFSGNVTTANITVSNGNLQVGYSNGSSAGIRFVCSSLAEQDASSTTLRTTSLTSGLAVKSSSASQLTLTKTVAAGEVNLQYNYLTAAKAINFGQSQINANAGSVKLQLSLANWQPLAATSQVVMTCACESATSDSFSELNIDENSADNTFVVRAKNSKFSASVSIAQSYYIDGQVRQSKLQVAEANGRFLVIFDSPQSSLQWDPAVAIAGTYSSSFSRPAFDFGTIVDAATSDTGKIVGIVLGVVLPLAFICCACIVILIIIVVIVFVVRRRQNREYRGNSSASPSGSDNDEPEQAAPVEAAADEMERGEVSAPPPVPAKKKKSTKKSTKRSKKNKAPKGGVRVIFLDDDDNFNYE